MRTTLAAIVRRFEAYARADISQLISDHDDMLSRGAPGAVEQYFSVGRAAIDIVARAMLAADKPACATVLDLPCGGGRVTRHLAAFLPDAELFVGELDDNRRRFVTETFGAKPIDAGQDFSISPPRRRFDLIFVGSLVTHLDAPLFIRAVEWLIAALAEDGLLVLTTHGRRHDYIERTLHHYIDPAKWAALDKSCADTGFGYVATERIGDLSYGQSWSAPSWLMRLIERDDRVRVVGFQEAAWDDHQDVLVLQRKSLYVS